MNETIVLLQQSSNIQILSKTSGNICVKSVFTREPALLSVLVRPVSSLCTPGCGQDYLNTVSGGKRRDSGFTPRVWVFVTDLENVIS